MARKAIKRLFALPVTNSDAANAQSQAGSWQFSPDVLAGLDADPRFPTGMVGATQLGPTPQGTDVVIGANGDATVRGTTIQVQLPGQTPTAPTPGTGAGVIALPASLAAIKPLGWLLILGAAVLIFRK